MSAPWKHPIFLQMTHLCVIRIEIKSIISDILLFSGAISGLEVNIQKSELVAVREVPHTEELANILNYSISSLPLKYLGLSLSASFKSKAIWDVVIEQMERKLV